MAAQVLRGRLGRLGRAEPAPLGEEERQWLRQELLLDAEDMPRRDGAQVLEVGPDRARLVGKALDKALLIALGVGRHGEFDAGIEEALEFVGHLVPFERAAREKIDDGADDRALFHGADVMEADVPCGAVAAEHMGLAAALPVLLQHQDLHLGDLGEKAGGRHSADSRSDDDRVPSRNHVASPQKFKH